MKHLIIVAAMALSSTSFGQVLEENKTDEFTHSAIKRTSWEIFCRGTFSNPGNVYFRLAHINDNRYFDLKIESGSVVIIDKGDLLYLKLDNDSVVILECLRFEISSAGGGSKNSAILKKRVEGVCASYGITQQNIEAMSRHKVVKMRAYTSREYVEYKVKDNMSESLSQALVLIN